MTDASGKTPGRTTGRALDDGVRERLLALFLEELTRASDEALARGVTPQEISAQLDARIARLRHQTGELSDGKQTA